MTMRGATAAACLAAGLLAAVPAMAQDHPPYQPTRDAAVTYRVTSDTAGGKAPSEVRIAVQAATGLARFELPGKGYALLDRRTDRMTIVMVAQHAYMEMPPGATGGARQFMLSPGMQFTRRGTDTVAGQGCTIWDVQSPDGAATICMTTEGVLLRAAGVSKDGRMRGGLEATAVSYAPQPANLFAPPLDYHKLDMAQMMMQLGVRPPPADAP